jgi:acetylornithine deacetylase
MSFLRGQKYKVERMPVAQPELAKTPGAGDGERFNVFAALPGVKPDIVLSTHMDTVPPFFGCSEDDQYLYGRGTCDAKGIIAAQVAAADQLRDQASRWALLFVVGEERDSAGAAVANLSPKGSRFLINGEPTDNRLALASKGALRVELWAKGRMAHSAYPELGESAIDKLISALKRSAGNATADRAGDWPFDDEHRTDSRRQGTERDRRQGGGASADPVGWPIGETKAEILRVVGDRAEVKVHSGTAVCADAKGRKSADDGGKVHDGHPKTDGLG